LIVFYPKGIKEKGGIRNQYSHVTDILPTTLEIAGIKVPETIKEIKQDKIQGSSLYASLNDAKAESLHKVQYYYIFGNRAIYKDGWKAAAAHANPFTSPNIAGKDQAPEVSNFDTDVWELYNLNEDFNERNNLAKKYPEKLAELKKLFDEQAKENNLYPLIDWSDVLGRKIHNPTGDKNQNLQELIHKAPQTGSTN
jgi:arylsulfatase